MTRRLYNEDSMIREFDAKVITCEKVENSQNFQIVLDKTAFFPEGGGQTADAGWLSFSVNGETCREDVIDVKDAGEGVYHILPREIAVGTKVKGALDWSDRFSKMQQHTGEHIISGLVCGEYNCNNVGFHLGEDTVTMDFDMEFNQKQIDEIERRANKVVWSNVPIDVLYPDESELPDINYRSKMEIEGQVRIVSVRGIDNCACCAPHVPFTSMVGMIKILSWEKHRGGVRLAIACGDRAYQDYKMKSDNAKQISRILSLREDEISEGVDKLNGDIQGLKYRVKQLEEEVVTEKVKLLLKGSRNPDVLLVLFENGLNAEQNRILVNQLVEKGFDCLSFIKAGEDIYQFIAGSKGNDMRKVADILRDQLQAKGGGKPQMVQGSVNASMNQIQVVIEKHLSDKIV